MSEINPQENEAQAPEGTPTVKLKLVTPMVLILIQTAAIVYSLRAATVFQNAIGLYIVPIVVVIGLAIWWLRAKHVSKRDRIGGLLLFIALLLLVAVTHTGVGSRLVVGTLPALTTTIVVFLSITASMAWSSRRLITIAAMVACTAYFTALRVDDIGGNLTPIVSWRWTEPPVPADAAWASETQEPTRSITLPAQSGPGDWAEFRGGNRDSRLSDVTFSTDWDSDPPKELWRRKVGLGWSSFTVIGAYLFTQEQRGQDEVVVCYEVATGNQMWASPISERFDEAMGSGPRATPTFHEGSLYTMGATGIVQALNASNGETLWQRDLKKDTNAKIPVWGFSSSPLIVNDMVIVFAGDPNGKSVVAYDLKSGDVRWTSGEGKHGYVSVQLNTLADVPQLLISSDIGIQSFAPDTGEKLWEHLWQVSTNPRCVQPMVPDGNSVLIGTAGGKGTRKLRIENENGQWTVSEDWTTRKFKPYFNDFVFYEDHFYGFDGKRLMCIDASTGERVWRGSNYGGQILLIEDMGLLLILSEKGNIALLKATPEGQEEITSIKAIEGKTWNHPVIADGKLFVRNSLEAVCYELDVTS